MRTVLAALDPSAAARPVIETALAIGRLMGADVEAIHVGEGSDEVLETLEALAASHEVPLRVARGPVESALLDAVAAPHVVAAVVGARATPGGRHPTGHVALSVVEHTDKPTVVVPPDTVDVARRPLRRLLLPLEGSREASRPVMECLCPLITDDIELVVLHVFTADTVPHVLDHPSRDLELLAQEFRARYCPPATRIDWRTGPIGTQVEEVCREEAADLIVLSWSQHLSDGHAAVVRDVLTESRVPVLLLPTTDT